MTPYLLLAGGLLLLTVGAGLLVRGASRLAAGLGVPPLAVGLTVVAFGTSAPELAVSMRAALEGDTAIALGNVVGSNIFNVLVILGLSALILPLTLSSRLIRRDVPLVVGASVLLLLLGLDGWISRVEGGLLAASILAYTWWTLRAGSRDPDAAADLPLPQGDYSAGLDGLTALIGLALLTLGSRWLVHGATEIALLLGVGPLVIGLTIVAGGTSLPELATSVVAASRGQRDLAVGNVVGSNLFNILAVLGGSALVSGGGIHVPPSALRGDIPVMIASALLCVPVFVTGRRIDRREGALLLAGYLAYLLWLLKVI